jgi:hypothetical protein
MTLGHGQGRGIHPADHPFKRGVGIAARSDVGDFRDAVVLVGGLGHAAKKVGAADDRAAGGAHQRSGQSDAHQRAHGCARLRFE